MVSFKYHILLHSYEALRPLQRKNMSVDITEVYGIVVIKKKLSVFITEVGRINYPQENNSNHTEFKPPY